MRRRLDLAASLVGRPAVVFLDEPTTGLDPSKRDDMWDVVRQLTADGSTVLLTTQYLEEADELADDIVVFDHGRVIAHGTPEELKRIAGDQTITVRPVDPRGSARSPPSSAPPPARARRSCRAGTVRAAATGDEALAAIVARLDLEGIAVTELSLRLPSLDEVFAVLTRREAPRTPIYEEVAA